MNKFTAQAPTIEEAIQTALNNLQASRDEVTIQVIQEAKKGFLGLGRQDAIVTVEKKEDRAMDFILEDLVTPSPARSLGPKEKPSAKEAGQKPPIETISEETSRVSSQLSDEEADALAIKGAEDYLASIIEMLDAEPYHLKLTRESDSNRVNFDIRSDKAGLLIGRHGKVLDAIQTLVQIYLYNQAESKLHARVDVENYKQRKEDEIIEIAQKASDRVKKTKQDAILEDFSANERKIIHRYLHKDPEVKTHSEGPKSNRYLVIQAVIDSPSILEESKESHD